MALSKSEVLALIPTPYVPSYDEYTIILESDGTAIGVYNFLLNQIGDSSQNGTTDIQWSITGVNSFTAVQTSGPFNLFLLDAKPTILISDTGQLLIVYPTPISPTQITYFLIYPDGTTPSVFPSFLTNRLLVTIRVFF